MNEKHYKMAPIRLGSIYQLIKTPLYFRLTSKIGDGILHCRDYSKFATGLCELMGFPFIFTSFLS